MKTFLSKYLPLLVTVLSLIASATVPAVQSFWASHPTVASVLPVVALFFPQPHGK